MATSRQYATPQGCLNETTNSYEYATPVGFVNETTSTTVATPVKDRLVMVKQAVNRASTY